jgi:hypothetical protein
MKTLLLLFSVLLAPVFASENQVCRIVTAIHGCTTQVTVLHATKSTKQTPPTSPVCKPPGKGRESRPALPSHLFM